MLFNEADKRVVKDVCVTTKLVGNIFRPLAGITRYSAIT